MTDAGHRHPPETAKVDGWIIPSFSETQKVIVDDLTEDCCRQDDPRRIDTINRLKALVAYKGSANVPLASHAVFGERASEGDG